MSLDRHGLKVQLDVLVEAYNNGAVILVDTVDVRFKHGVPSPLCVSCEISVLYKIHLQLCPQFINP